MVQVETSRGEHIEKSSGGWREAFGQWLTDRPDDAVLRWLFRGMIAATVVVVALDYTELRGTLEHRTTGPAVLPTSEPLPPSKRTNDDAPGRPTRAPSAGMRETMTFELGAGGRLTATGVITPGIAKVFAKEIDKRGTYVKTIVIQSPGGSVQDALEMGRLIRDKGYATEVKAGAYCASSCPLMFAAGVQRLAGKGAAIGVHQVSAAVDSEHSSSGAMAGAQQISAICQKYLRDMGVDLGVWVHAMETPKEQLYYFTAEELLSLKLATSVSGSRPVDKKS